MTPGGPELGNGNNARAGSAARTAPETSILPKARTVTPVPVILYFG